MKIYFLKDLAEDCIDAVIITETSTKKDIIDAIGRAKQKEDYTWEDMINEFPNDCTVYDRWGCNVIYY